ncbi:ABC transporter ATP-binding protein [Chloroflexota bacterium]
MTTGDKNRNILELSAVDAGYGPVTILRQVNLHVKMGEVIALLGANGMGKTTLLHTIVGLLPTVRGEIIVNGQAISGISPQQAVSLGMALIPEGRLLFPLMTVLENLKLGAYHLRGKGKREEIERNLASVFKLFPVLEERKGQQAGTLSGGEQQMVAVGRGLMGRPTLLLLDEPSVGLAPMLVSQLMDTLSQLRTETGMSILIAEQNARAALRIADRGYILGGGTIIMDGSSQKIRDTDAIRAAYLGKAV